MSANAAASPSILHGFGASLLADLDRLRDELVERIYATYPAYHDTTRLDDEELRETVRRNLRRSLQRVAGLVPEPLERDQYETGRRRVSQGVPLEAVLGAYRLGWQLLWEHTVDLASRESSRSQTVGLLEAVGWLWEELNADSAAVGEGYQAEENRLRRQDLRRQQAVLDAVLRGRCDDPAAARDAARTLDLPLHGPLVCVVALAGAAGEAPLLSPTETLGARGLSSVWLVRTGTEVGLVSLAKTELQELARLLQAAAFGPVGLSPVVQSLQEIPRAHRLAELAAHTVAPRRTEVVLLTDRLPEALLAAAPDVAAIFSERTVGLLASLPPEERAVLVGTVEALIACDWSPTQAATALHCHRNTVMYRLQRITAITGTSVVEPRHRVLWTLGLLAAVHHGPDAASGIHQREPAR